MSEKRGESDEAVGRGPRAAFRTVRGTVPTMEQSLQRGTVPTTGNSLHRKHVMAAVGNGSQPFRRIDEQPPPAPPSGGHEQ